MLTSPHQQTFVQPMMLSQRHHGKVVPLPPEAVPSQGPPDPGISPPSCRRRDKGLPQLRARSLEMGVRLLSDPANPVETQGLHSVSSRDAALNLKGRGWGHWLHSACLV